VETLGQQQQQQQRQVLVRSRAASLTARGRPNCHPYRAEQVRLVTGQPNTPLGVSDQRQLFSHTLLHSHSYCCADCGVSLIPPTHSPCLACCAPTDKPSFDAALLRFWSERERAPGERLPSTSIILGGVLVEPWAFWREVWAWGGPDEVLKRKVRGRKSERPVGGW
jgi:hypothetical protein